MHAAFVCDDQCSFIRLQTPTTCTLAEFLINNEGKRCVVVLDVSVSYLDTFKHDVKCIPYQEIEKTDDEKALWSLLGPWEHGRCSIEANGRPIDVRNVIWLGTSNIGHDLVFQHRDARKHPEELMTREEYVDLMGVLRRRVSERLGVSLPASLSAIRRLNKNDRRLSCQESQQSCPLSHSQQTRRRRYPLRLCINLEERRF